MLIFYSPISKKPSYTFALMFTELLPGLSLFFSNNFGQLKKILHYNNCNLKDRKRYLLHLLKIVENVPEKFYYLIKARDQ